MGTYTANYNLYIPTIGEQGWGELMNGNLTTIDTTMKGLDTRATALESADTAFDTRIAKLESGEFENITVAENVNGNVTGFLYLKSHFTGTSGDQLYATCPQQSVEITSNYNTAGATTLVIGNTYSDVAFGNPQKISHGIYSRRSDVSGLTNPTQRTIHVRNTASTLRSNFYYKKSTESSYASIMLSKNTVNAPSLSVLTWDAGATYQFYCRTIDAYGNENGEYTNNVTITVLPVEAYVTYDTP